MRQIVGALLSATLLLPQVSTRPPQGGGGGGFTGGAVASPILLPNGTQALPALAFASETNLGCFRVSADNMSCTTGSALPYAQLNIGTPQSLFYFWDATANASGLSASDGAATIFADNSPFTFTPGFLQLPAVVFLNLGAPLNGTIAYCSNCTIANPCASGGTGALAKRLNSVWVCN
jgi:hypothetical protein